MDTLWLKYIEHWDQVSLGMQVGEAEVVSGVFPAKPCVSPFPHIWPSFSWWPIYICRCFSSHLPLGREDACALKPRGQPALWYGKTPDESPFRVSFWDYRRLVCKRNPFWCHFKRRSQIRQTQVWLLVLPCSRCGSCTVLKCTVPSLLFPPSLPLSSSLPCLSSSSSPFYPHSFFLSPLPCPPPSHLLNPSYCF